jgi:hypothetical protein
LTSASVGFTVTITEADFEESEADVAVTVTVSGEVTFDGALNIFGAPLPLDFCAIPPQEFTPIGQETVQFRPLPLESPLTVAEIGSAWFMSML